MSKVKIGKHYEILIMDYTILDFDFSQFINIGFVNQDQKEDWKYELEIWGNYIINRFGQSKEFQPTDIEGFKCLLDFLHEKIKSCTAFKNGGFFLETEKGNSIEIKDGLYENWQFKIHQKKVSYKTKSHLIGGSKTVIFREH